MSRMLVLVTVPLTVVAGLVWGWVDFASGLASARPRTGQQHPASDGGAGRATPDPTRGPGGKGTEHDSNRPAGTGVVIVSGGADANGSPGGGKPASLGPGAEAGPRAEAAVALREAEELFRLARFREAEARLSKADAGAAGIDLGRRVQALAARSRALAGLLQEVPPGAGSDLANAVVVVLQSGSRIEARLVKEGKDEVVVRRQNGAEAVLPRDKVREIQRISPEDLRARLEEEYAARVRKNEPATAFGHFEVAVFCYQNGLPAHVTEELELALARDPDLARTIAEEMAKRLYQACLWFDARGNVEEARKALRQLLSRYASTSYASVARKEVGELLRDGAVAAGPSGTGASGAGGTGGGQEPPDPAKTGANTGMGDGALAGGGGSGTGQPPGPGPGPGDGGSGAALAAGTGREGGDAGGGAAGAGGSSGGDAGVGGDLAGPGSGHDAAGGGGAVEVSSAKADAAAAVARANKLYEEGMRHFESSGPGSANAKEENRLAYQCFSKAVDSYDEACTLDPGNNGIARRLDEARILKVKTFRRQKAF
ncbi:MAG: hypothetical protein HYZ53_20670 [Planctomycetes bacterium]|nr:hypothetical protein [Planctomycetota bacterium]